MATRQIIVRTKPERTMSKKMAEVRVTSRPSRASKGSHVLSGVPLLAKTPEALRKEKLDSRLAFLLSFVDGTLSVETILDVCSMPREEALAGFGELAARSIIVFAPKLPRGARASTRPGPRASTRPGPRASVRPGSRASKRPPR